jgi:hypothetical protein
LSGFPEAALHPDKFSRELQISFLGRNALMIFEQTPSWVSFEHATVTSASERPYPRSRVMSSWPK